MPEQFLMWVLSSAVSALAVVLWYIGRKSVDSIERMNQTVTDLKVSVANDMGTIRERLARLEGHAGITK